MWIPFVLTSLTAGVASLLYFLLANKKSWTGFGLSMQFLVFWLPSLSLLTLVLLCWLAARTGLRWTGTASLIVFLAAFEFWLLLVSETSLWTMCFLPAILVMLAGFALAVRSYPEGLAAVVWVQRAAPVLAIAAILAVVTCPNLRR